MGVAMAYIFSILFRGILLFSFGSVVIYATENSIASKWQVLSEEDGFITKRKEVSESSIFAFRGEMTADVHISKIISVFSLELLPRITRAQSMDILSSQANLAGYKAVIESFSDFEKVGTMKGARKL